KNKKIKTLVCLGSGGHTSEMLQIIEILDKNKYEPIIYMLADTDQTSLNKINQLNLINNNNYYLIPRSRQVHQSYLTSVFSTIQSLIYVLYLLIFKINQLNLIICNGPGTCVPIILTSFILYKLMYLNNNCKLIYIESICRQHTLSITGLILFYFVDLFVIT
ncbi:UDP-N-acetylglucosamine transferase subunit ALG14 homolog, partial [Chrysoperla carnea]|uniref:UDP-N-acetylglucosamine transferase subunit ALG14 homolog n=1 Tax=Chrysoperla carnea TaxID=189513 RepID=UPI001D078B34